MEKENRYDKWRREKHCYVSDLGRMDIIEDFFKEVEQNPDYNISSPNQGMLVNSENGYPDQIYIQNNLKNNEIIYYEGWVPACWEGARIKKEYKGLKKDEIIKHLIENRFPLVAKEFDMEIADYSYWLKNGRYIMKVVLRKKHIQPSDLDEGIQVFDDIDVKEIATKLAKRLKLPKPQDLHRGNNGYAYLVGNKVLKITSDISEINEAQKLKGKKNKHLADVYAAFKVKYNDFETYAVICELLDKSYDIDEKIDIADDELRRQFFDNNQLTNVYGEGVASFFHYYIEGSYTQRDVKFVLSQIKDKDVIWYFSQMIKIINELIANGIKSHDVVLPNLGLKKGNLAYFDYGYGDEQEYDHETIHLNESVSKTQKTSFIKYGEIPTTLEINSNGEVFENGIRQYSGNNYEDGYNFIQRQYFRYPEVIKHFTLPDNQKKSKVKKQKNLAVGNNIDKFMKNLRSFAPQHILTSKKIYSQEEMAKMGGMYNLQHGVLMLVPINKITGEDPEPGSWTDDEGYTREFKKGTKVTTPIELEYHRDEDLYYMQNGNHRLKQEKINGNKYILAFVQADKQTYKDWFS